MVASTAVPGPTGRRGMALVGLSGALLGGIGDVLILGRPCSGREFDHAAGMVPPHIDADPKWRSLWNGAGLPVRRIQAGTVTGYVGIGLLQLLAMRGISRTIPAGRQRSIAAGAATAFAVSGVLTHQCCATVILAYKRAAAESRERSDGAPRRPGPDTRLLAVSAAACLGALAVFSASLTVPELRDRSTPAWWSTVTPFPCVMATLLTFGRLPAPVGGYARPASINAGLLTYFALTAARQRRR
nr:hypothetical protein [uncultured Friedmanniella sp.]